MGEFMRVGKLKRVRFATTTNVKSFERTPQLHDKPLPWHEIPFMGDLTTADVAGMKATL